MTALCAQNSATVWEPKIVRDDTYGKKIAPFSNQWFSAVTKLIFKLFGVFKRSWAELFIFLIKNSTFLLQWDQNQWLSGPKKSKFDFFSLKYSWFPRKKMKYYWFSKKIWTSIIIDLKFHSGSNGSTLTLWKSL